MEGRTPFPGEVVSPDRSSFGCRRAVDGVVLWRSNYLGRGVTAPWVLTEIRFLPLFLVIASYFFVANQDG